MADGDDTFSVDIEALERGGANIKQLAALMGSIYGDLSKETDKHGRDLGGNGSVGASFADYYEGADAGLQFLRELKDLVDTHGGKTVELGALFGNVDETTTNQAGGHRH